MLNRVQPECIFSLFDNQEHPTGDDVVSRAGSEVIKEGTEGFPDGYDLLGI